MNRLLELVGKLRESSVKNLVDTRIKEFREAGKRTGAGIFKELCYCILTANFNAERSIRIQKDIEGGFLVLSESQLAKKLKSMGHRFPNARARYIVEARRYKNSLKTEIGSIDDNNQRREWLVHNIKGIGYKEASHFLRNIGYENYAIIDFHIRGILGKFNLIKGKMPVGTLAKNRYIEIEEVLRGIAVKLEMNLAELDLYLWYMETGKVLK